MNFPLLERITLEFPGTHPEFHDRFLDFLSAVGSAGVRKLDLPVSEDGFLPRLSFDFQSASPEITADFHFASADLSVPLRNITGVEKRNPLPYQPLSLDEAARRIREAGWTLAGIDHIGFNLPWFRPGLHPGILKLRDNLAGACLYHEYPSGEPWDFILPGTAEEIAGRINLDYSKTRRPKFELVSFEGASTPLVQIDLGVDARFDKMASSFPEALIDTALRQTWIYTENPYPLDICLVLNERSARDWSDFFAGHRLGPISRRGG